MPGNIDNRRIALNEYVLFVGANPVTQFYEGQVVKYFHEGQWKDGIVQECFNIPKSVIAEVFFYEQENVDGINQTTFTIQYTIEALSNRMWIKVHGCEESFHVTQMLVTSEDQQGFRERFRYLDDRTLDHSIMARCEKRFETYRPPGKPFNTRPQFSIYQYMQWTKYAVETRKVYVQQLPEMEVNLV